MNKLNTKIIISLTAVSLFIIFTAVFTIQENCSNSRINKDPANNLLNLDLNDGLQESENLSVCQKFQDFWTDVYAQDAVNWSYLDWRNYIILQIYGDSENNLNNTITNDPLFENNIDIFTIYVMGKYNNSLTDEEITNLKSQIIHNTVHIGDILYLKNDDDQLKLYINIEVESSPSMWYVADHLKIYLKSNNSNGKWYNASGDHYVKVYDISNLEFSDLIHTDGKSENHILGPIILNTNTIEENISLIASVEYFLNFLWDDYVEKLESFNLADDDVFTPEISYTYTGNYTDGDPGQLIVNASDNSGLTLDPSGIYDVPSTLGIHEFTFTASDADNDRLDDCLNTTITVSINITDDDILSPVITYIYTGNYTDGDPGQLIVNASDNSGLTLDPSGIYDVPSTLGIHEFTFTASDADIDRLGDCLNTTITVSINITDDDFLSPVITYIYTGDYTDGNPGQLIINASDNSGLTLDPSGIYDVPSTLGIHEFTFTASDADIDRLGDCLNTTITVSINITDDDFLSPVITYIYTGDYTDSNPGQLIVNASDNSGLTLDPSGIYDVPSTLGIHEFTFTASDADIDRLGDCLNTTITVSINITDDDILSPVITYIYTGNYTDGDPGQFIVNASDNSGLTLDPSGIYDVPSTLGIHEFTFTASDADVDRLGDYLNTTITVWINITDDDDEGPLIIDVDIINNRVYDYYEFIIIVISVEDASGISDLFIEVNDTRYYDDDRDNQILIENPRLLEIFNYFTVVAIDADNDREEDQKVSELICSFEVFDDDSTPPEIHFYYEDFSYQLSIVDNDGIEDSKATGEFFLIDEQGIILQSGVILLEDVNYTINIPLKPGNYCLEVYTTNNDRDFEGDEEYNNEIFRISVDLENCFLRVDKLLGDLIDYVDENLYFIIANSIGFKLCFARQDLWQAYLLVEAGDLNKGVFNELIIQAIIEFVEFETEFYNKIDLISTAIIDDMISFLHQIRNFVVLMMGNSVDYVKGISCGYDIASIEVELLNLEDFIEEQLGDCNCKYLEHLIKLSAMQLELAIIKLSRDINPDSALSLAKQFIDRAREETLDLLENNKISVDISSILLDSLNNCYSKIEELDLNNS